MDYIKVVWHMALANYETEPIEFYYEVEDQKLVRGLELFIDRSYQILPAGQDIPTIEYMNDQADTFTAFGITESEFDFHWAQANHYSKWRFLIPGFENVIVFSALFLLSLMVKLNLRMTSKITSDFFRGMPFPFLRLNGTFCGISWPLCVNESIDSVSYWMLGLNLAFLYLAASLIARDLFPFLRKIRQ